MQGNIPTDWNERRHLIASHILNMYLHIFNENKTISATKSQSAGKQSTSSVCKDKEGNSSFANKGKTQSLVLKWLQSTLGRILHLNQPSKCLCQHTQYSVTTKDILNNIKLKAIKKILTFQNEDQKVRGTFPWDSHLSSVRDLGVAEEEGGRDVALYCG